MTHIPQTRWNRLARSVLAAAILASAVSACAPLMLGGAVTSVVVASDRRTSGAQLEDQGIELRSANRLRDVLGERGSVSVTSYNRQVLLTGQVPDETARARATEVVRGVPDVRTVFNELALSGVTSLTSQANDTTVTGNVKARLLRDERVPGTQIKVLTEAGVVYLMGLVTKAEADVATDIARTTSGVTKVVTLFETIN